MTDITDRLRTYMAGPADIEVAADTIEALRAEVDRLRAALTLIATPRRPDGTYNRDRAACEALARAALGEKP